MSESRLSLLSNPAAVQAALDEYERLGRDGFLTKYGYGRSRDYLIRNPRTGELADSKAIAGVAFGVQYPESGPLKATQFSGGEITVAHRMTALGFEIERVGDDWGREEVQLIVRDYVSMLVQELTGQTYNKSQHRRSLQAKLKSRSEGAIEFKHCNISAVLVELGFPYLKGYKPRVNFQRSLLTEVVAAEIANTPVLDDAALSAVERPAITAEILDFSHVIATAPKREVAAHEPAPSYGNPTKRDYLEREARNQSLGRAGEEFALRFEQWRLSQRGLGQLADRVQHVSVTQGDGLGYDILSFEPDGRERFIEVKTTAFGQKTPFFVSANEVRFARREPEQFRLYRLFEFRANPRLFELVGPVENHCSLDATTYRATFG